MKERLRLLLTQRKKHYIADAGRVPSAVMVPIYQKQEQYYILFIKRSEKVKAHKGEISFPGGTSEEADRTLLDTALRECAEETGLRAEHIEVLGELDDKITITSNYIVSPFIAMIPWPYEFKVSKDEVNEIIEIPISALTDKNRLHRDALLRDGEAVESIAYHYQGRIIWGATAQILKEFLDIFARATEYKPAA